MGSDQTTKSKRLIDKIWFLSFYTPPPPTFFLAVAIHPFNFKPQHRWGDTSVYNCVMMQNKDCKQNSQQLKNRRGGSNWFHWALIWAAIEKNTLYFKLSITSVPVVLLE